MKLAVRMKNGVMVKSSSSSTQRAKFSYHLRWGLSSEYDLYLCTHALATCTLSATMDKSMTLHTAISVGR